MWGWGDNGKGQLGDAYTWSNKLRPVQVKSNAIQLQIDSPFMEVNGYTREIDPGKGTSPIIIESKTFLPIRALIEELGGTVGWNGGENKITLNINSTTIEMWIGNSITRINGVERKIDPVPQTVNNRTMVPLRYVIENLGYNVQWNDSDRSITVGY